MRFKNLFLTNNVYTIIKMDNYNERAIVKTKSMTPKKGFPNMNKYLEAEKGLKYCYVFSNDDGEWMDASPMLARDCLFMKFKYIRNYCSKELEHHLEDVLYVFYLLIDAINKKLTLDELVEKTMSYKLNNLCYNEQDIEKIKDKDKITNYWKVILDANMSEVDEDIDFFKLHKLITEKFDENVYNITCGAYCSGHKKCNLFCMTIMNEVIYNLLGGMETSTLEYMYNSMDDISIKITDGCLKDENGCPLVDGCNGYVIEY